MKIKKLKISNFKSFKEVSLDFENINIFIGSNATGKSNLISALKFINNIIQFGIEDAVSLAGGVKFLSNINLDLDVPVSFEMVFCLEDFNWKRRIPKIKDKLMVLSEINYIFEIQRKKRGNGFRIIKDLCILKEHLISKDETDINQQITQNNDSFDYVIEIAGAKVKNSIQNNTTSLLLIARTSSTPGLRVV